MGFFKDVKKAYKTGQKAQKQYQRAVPQTPKVSSPPPPQKQTVPAIDPSWLVLPMTLPSDLEGVSVTKVPRGEKKILRIVGEQWRHGAIQGVMNAGGQNGFEIYLMNDHNNAHDKKAVGVYAAGQLIGYIPKPDNKVWNKLVANASNNRQLLWGEATAYVRKDGYWQVKGFIYHENLIAPPLVSLEPKKMTPAAMTKNAKVLSDAVDADIETVAQARSWSKKAAKAAASFYCHALWVLDQGENEEWDEIKEQAAGAMDDAEDMAFYDDEIEYPIMAFELLLEAVQTVMSDAKGGE